VGPANGETKGEKEDRKVLESAAEPAVIHCVYAPGDNEQLWLGSWARR
jgi:hypothetical protein